jgi:hypothetical protein
MFAALFSGQLIATTPDFSRETAPFGFIRVIQLFLFDRRRHFLNQPHNATPSGGLSTCPIFLFCGAFARKPRGGGLSGFYSKAALR